MVKGGRRVVEIIALSLALLAGLGTAALVVLRSFHDKVFYIAIFAIVATSLIVSLNITIFSGAGLHMVLTVFTICLFAFVLGWILYILFHNPVPEEEKTETLSGDNDITTVPIVPVGDVSTGEEEAILAEWEPVGEEESSTVEIEDATEPEVDAVPSAEEEIQADSSDTSTESLVVDEKESVSPDIISPDEAVAMLATLSDAYTVVEDTQTGTEMPQKTIADTDAEILPQDGTGMDVDSAVPGETTTATVVSVPDAPEGLFNNVTVEETETYGIYTDPFSDDDFWASFYIAGQDELSLEDGIYYMSLYINEVYTGVVTTQITGGLVSLNAGELEGYTTGTLTDEASSRVFSGRGDYISLDELEEVGVETSFDPMAYEVHLSFAATDMPVQILSVRGSARRTGARPISGGVSLDPAFFTLISRYSLSMGFSDVTAQEPLSNMWGYLSSSNSGRISNVNFDFSYGFRFTATSISPTSFTWSFHRDWPEEMIRLQWGLVSTSLLAPTGGSLGVRFDKSLSYADDTSRRRSHTEQLIVVEKTSDVEIFNEGRSIFKRTLSPGMYRLQDFVLYSGANRILIRVSPLDGSPIQEIEFDVLYSASLLAPGEAYYGLALGFSRQSTYKDSEKARTAFSLPLLFVRRIDYNFLDAVLSGYVRAGLSEHTTMNATLAIQNRPTDEALLRLNGTLAGEFTNINPLGSSRLTFTVRETSEEDGTFTLPSLSVNLGHQVNTGASWLSGISLGASWSSPLDWNFSMPNMLNLNAGVSGSIGMIGWSLSGYGGFDLSDPTIYSWSASASLGASLMRNLYLSASMSVTGATGMKPTVSGRISATMRFGGASVSASTNLEDASIRVSANSDRHYFSAGFTSQDPLDYRSWNASASYSYGGRRLSLGFDLNSSSFFDTVGLSANISTSTVFADGLFALASSIPSNFLLVRQGGALKDNSLSIGTPGSSSFADTPTTFGTALYTGLPSYGNTSLMIYSSGEDQFSTTDSIALNLRESDMSGYVYTISADDSWSASGLVYLPDGSLWLNGSSPVYSVEIAEDGTVATYTSDLYVFTDTDGRFVLSQLPEGLYAFDVPYDGGWLLYIFPVDGSEDASLLQMLGEPVEALGLALPDVYQGALMYSLDRTMTSEEFFNMLYPQASGEVAV